MMRPAIVLIFLLAVLPAAAQDNTPRTGYFRVHTTPLDLLGEDGAASLSGIFEPDEKLEWQLYVPTNYDPGKPAGVIVFLTHSNSWGGSRREYNPALEESNLIWAGVLGAGAKSPVNERMLRLIMTPTMLARTYSLDPQRVYIGGFAGGAHVATIAATGKPDLFKGGMFIGGAVAWGDELPTRIDEVRKNAYVFVAGSNDIALNTIHKAAIAFRKAGVERTEVIIMPNQRQEMPGRKYLLDAIDFLDGNNSD